MKIVQQGLCKEKAEDRIVNIVLKYDILKDNSFCTSKGCLTHSKLQSVAYTMFWRCNIVIQRQNKMQGGKKTYVSLIYMFFLLGSMT